MGRFHFPLAMALPNLAFFAVDGAVRKVIIQRCARWLLFANQRGGPPRLIPIDDEFPARWYLLSHSGSPVKATGGLGLMGRSGSNRRTLMKEKRAQRLLSARELAEYTGLSVDTIYRWAAKQRIPALHVGRMLKFDLADIDRWIEESKKVEKRRGT